MVVSPEGGTAASEVGTHTYDLGLQVEIFATPNEGYRFTGWSVDLGNTDNVDALNVSGTNVTMFENMTFMANFSKIEYTLAVNIVGDGTVSLDPAVGPSYPLGTEVTLDPQAGLGWTFAGWSGGLSGSDDPAKITMDSNKSITATFTQD